MRKTLLLLFSLLFFSITYSYAQVNIATSGTPGTIYYGSPSITKLTSGNIVVSHDFFGSGAPMNGAGENHQGEVYRSIDDGLTWASVDVVSGMFWGSLFEHSGDLYSLAYTQQFGNLVIRKSVDEGLNWSSPATLGSLTFPHSGGGQPPIEHNGKLWYAFDTTNDENVWGGFSLNIAWITSTNDLMIPSNWSFSSAIAWSTAWEGDNWDNPAMLESDAFVAPDGTLKILCRVNSEPETTGFAILFDVNSTTGAITNGKRVNLPGGDKKFQVQVASGRIWVLTNPDIYPVGLYTASNSRNVLELYSSIDGINWQRHKRFIDNSNLDPTQYGDQYVSWEFDGTDIIAAIRTADVSANNAHNSNKINFYRFTDWDIGWDSLGL